MRIYVSIQMTAFVLAAMVLGCGSNSPKAAAPPRPTAIEGTVWQLVDVGGQPAEPVAAGERPASFRLDAADKRVSGYAGLNQLNGPYELNGSALKFGMPAMTRRAGPEPLMRQESAFSRAMEQTTSWRSAGLDEIELLDSGNKPLARFKRVSQT